MDIPKRIPNQKWIEENLPKMDEETYLNFLEILETRRWTEEEFGLRIFPIRTPEIS